MGFLGNTERIVTRALAIGFIAVGAGAAHSWLNGPLRDAEPAQTSADNTGAPGEAPQQPGQGEEDTGDASSAASPPPVTQPQDPPAQLPEDQLPEDHVTMAEAFAHWENATATFIDTRSASVFAEGHIAGALNLSLEMTGDPTAVNNVLQWITPEDTLILYCKGGLCDESKNVADLLKGAGFNKTLIMGDGYPGWVAAGHMTESGGG